MKHIRQSGFLTLTAILLLTGCSEEIVNAGYNTLLGMGMAFLVLIIISLVISVFPMIGKLQQGKKEDKQMRLDAIDKTVGQIAQKEEKTQALVTADADIGTDELIAVIAAAIHAYETEMTSSHAAGRDYSDAYVDDFDPTRDYGTYRVRSIRRIRHASSWKKA